MLITSRRAFLGGLLSALAAPAIVHAGNIMPVRNVIILPSPGFDSFDKLMPDGMQYQWVLLPSGYAVDPCIPLGKSIGDDGMQHSWLPLPASRYRSEFAIASESIKIGDCVLVERPKVHHIAARGAEIEKAYSLNEQWARRAKAQGFDGFARSPRDFTRISGGIA